MLTTLQCEMLNLETISTVLDEFGGASVSIAAEHCLNARHKDAGCRLCADACPTEAIELQLDRPRLRTERCVSCGLCLHWCPTDVFTQRGAPEPHLAQSVSLLPDDAISLTCPQHGDPGNTSAPVTAVVQHKRCLAALSVPLLMELSDGSRRTIWLDDSPCAACPIGRAQPAIAQTARTANQLLQAFDHPAAIHTHLSDPDGLTDAPASKPVLAGDRPQVSRRGFFSALSQLTRRTTATVISEALPAPHSDTPVPVDQRLPHRIPSSRGHLYHELKRLGEPAADSVETAGIPFANVIVEADACSACGLCARFCPTGALRFVTDAESFVLHFRSSICIDCGICSSACPEDAVSFGSTLAPSALIGTAPHPLVAGTLAPCAGCGERTAVGVGGTDAPRCYVCRHSTDPMAPLRDTAGLISDLVRRLPDASASADSEKGDDK